MNWSDPGVRKHLKTVAIWAAVILAYLVIGIDDWSRDLVEHEATRPFAPQAARVQRLLDAPPGDPNHVAAADWAVAVRWAGNRIKNFELTGEISDGDTRILTFVRKHRLLRVTDDVTVRIESSGRTQTIEATSSARLHIGDLGRNTKTLKRLFAELEDVVAESNLNILVVTGL